MVPGDNATSITVGGDTWLAAPTTDVFATPIDRRTDHTMIPISGTECIAWGGQDSFGPINTGYRYDSVANTWTPIDDTDPDTPTARIGHTAVWSGTQMIVWGGQDGGGPTNTGGVYDLLTDSWTATNPAGAPNPRVGHSAVFLNAAMIVFGGQELGGPQNDLFEYDPGTDTWFPLPGLGAPPSPRRDALTIAFPGLGAAGQIFVWGGDDGSGNPLGDGALYDVATATWTAVSPAPIGPRKSATIVQVSGQQAIIWGGNTGAILSTPTNTGAMYNAATDLWSPLPILAATPSARFDHTAAWNGTEMIVWGGTDGAVPFGDGARYNPGTDNWTPMSASPLAPRSHAEAVAFGPGVFIFGGTDGVTPLDTGALYVP